MGRWVGGWVVSVGGTGPERSEKDTERTERRYSEVGGALVDKDHFNIRSGSCIAHAMDCSPRPAMLLASERVQWRCPEVLTCFGIAASIRCNVRPCRSVNAI